MKINSKKYPNIEYTPSNDIFIFNDVNITPFYFSVSEDLTSDESQMDKIGAFLDNLDEIKTTAIAGLKKALEENNETVEYFLTFHRDEQDEDFVRKLSSKENAKELPLSDWLDFLELKAFACCIDEEINGLSINLDFSFNPDMTDELLVVYFNEKNEIYYISHES